MDGKLSDSYKILLVSDVCFTKAGLKPNEIVAGELCGLRERSANLFAISVDITTRLRSGSSALAGAS